VTTTQQPVLEARGVTRTFGAVQALDGVDFDVHAGEVVALIGDNGAGKSTLVKILSGADQPSSGTILLDGKELRLDSPSAAREAGIETVFQDLALAPHLNAVENMYLGRELPAPGLLRWLGMLDRRTMAQRSREAFDDLGATVPDLYSPVGSMSGGQKQSIAVARSATWADKVIFLDEPTAALGVVQTQNVLDLVKRVRDRGVGVVLISHSMPHVMEVADRVQVLRRGQRVATYRPSEIDVTDLVAAMTGATAMKAS
jgi:simple sugar transport system ATP-binding protein